LQQCKRFSVDFPATLGIDPDKLDADGQPQEIDADHFHRTADLTLGELLQKVDQHLQQQGADAGMRVDMTEGKLQIHLGEGRALVLSKDPEARQLHASGAGGDASYALAEESSGVLQTSGTEGPRWAAVDGGEDLHEVVEAELEAATGQRIDLEPEPRSGYGPDPT
jgi:frataxin-like iron-binding protein CyaY